MAGKIDQWLGADFALTGWRDADRAFGMSRMIGAKSVSITITRRVGTTTSTLTAQTVRIENIDNVPFERLADGRMAVVNGLRCIVIGYKGHPTITDTDIQFGDRFSHEGQMFEVLQAEPGYTDRVIAIAEAVD